MPLAPICNGTSRSEYKIRENTIRLPDLAPLVRGHRLLLLTFCSLLVRLQRDRAGGGNARLGLTLLRDLTGPSATEFECRVDGKLSKYGVSRGNRERSTSSGERPLLQDVAIS